MSPADDVLPRYTEELRGFGPSLPDDLAAGARALEPRLTPEELDQWAAAGVALARHSLRSNPPEPTVCDRHPQTPGPVGSLPSGAATCPLPEAITDTNSSRNRRTVGPVNRDVSTVGHVKNVRVLLRLGIGDDHVNRIAIKGAEVQSPVVEPRFIAVGCFVNVEGKETIYEGHRLLMLL